MVYMETPPNSRSLRLILVLNQLKKNNLGATYYYMVFMLDEWEVCLYIIIPFLLDFANPNNMLTSTTIWVSFIEI